jgi:FADH2 O2-dependent halogenase
VAGYLAKAGVDYLMRQRDLFPRLHVGESLVPCSTRVFKDLSLLDKMEEAKFPHT